MAKVAFVTDSTGYIPPHLIEDLAITIIPQELIWGKETFLDGVDIQPDEFYRRLQTAKTMPTTSQAQPARFLQVFQSLLEQDYQILNILISEKLSGTISSAVQAKGMLPEAPIEIVDSRTTAMAMGFLVLETARLAREGASLEECKQYAERGRDNTGLLVTVDTLEFLHRGGRIGGGARFLGTALNIKPILELVDGRLEAVERVRTRSKALNRVSELVENRIAGRQPVRLAALHANCQGEAHELLDRLVSQIGAVEQVLTDVSPVVGTHVGPGTIGVCFMAGE
jgi:DegV family protein with EDD domain